MNLHRRACRGCASIPDISTATDRRNCSPPCALFPPRRRRLRRACRNRDGRSRCACRTAGRSVGYRTRAATAISRRIPRPGGPGRRYRRRCCVMGRAGPLPGPAGGLSDQLLRPDRENGSASGSRRGGFRRAGGLDFAGRFLPVPRRRTETQRAHPRLPPQLGRRRSSSAATPALPSMASIEFIRAHRACSRKGDGSI